MPLSSEEDAALRRQINREIDADLERRLIASQQPPRARNDDKVAAARALEQQRQAAAREWVEGAFSARLAVQRDMLLNAVGGAIGCLRGALRKENTVALDAARIEIVEQLRREFTMQLDHAKAEMAAAIRQEVAASLKRSTDRKQTAEIPGAALN